MVMAPPDDDLDPGAVRAVTDHLAVLGEIVVVPERVFGADSWQWLLLGPLSR